MESSGCPGPTGPRHLLRGRTGRALAARRVAPAGRRPSTVASVGSPSPTTTRRWTCAAPSVTRSVRAANRSGRGTGDGAPGLGGSSCWSTCRDRCSRTPGPCSDSPTRPSRPSVQVEVFALGTRLTRLSRELASQDPDAALVEPLRRCPTSRAAPGSATPSPSSTTGGACAAWPAARTSWCSGTGGTAATRTACREQMARLHRVTHRLIWVNPLRASPGYAPLARGMAAALAHVDEFVDGHSVASLADLADLLADDPDPHRRVPGRMDGPLPSTV